jgi:SAM-dependent methyltransferase
MAETAAAWQHDRIARPLFLGTVLLGSFLLFLTQPMIARMALPRVGGAPAVWNSAMLVYQALLLGGYAWAHWLVRLRPRLQAALHLGAFALAALWLPIGLRAVQMPTEAPPSLWVPWFLLSSMGPLFFIVSAQAPLMQRWYALESARGEPYPLYAASNLGSFAGLICYPLLVEPLLTLDQQSLLWTTGYALLVVLVAACAMTVPAHAVETPPARHSDPPGIRRVTCWIALAAVPSGLMLSTTTHLTTDIVAVPMLWVLPLGLYLLSFVVAFARRRGLTEFITLLAPLIILITGGLAFASGVQNPLFSATLGLSLLFVTAVALHGEMYRLRPAPDRLTAFYLAMALGGVLGGIFCALLAPTVFDWAYEHPLLILAAAFLVPQMPLLRRIERIWTSPAGKWLAIAVPALALAISLAVDGPYELLSGTTAIIGIVVIAVLALLSLGRRPVFAACLAALMLSYGGWWTLDVSLNWETRTRSYFGIYAINKSSDGNAMTLTHGTTLHGMQLLDPALRLEPTTYYSPRSGVGLAALAAETLYGPGGRIGVVGLGTGTLACYALPDQRWRFFEIDPAMVRIATQSGYFDFVENCAPQARIVLGDARLSLARSPRSSFDMLALDAFSSDAVPMHLLTSEAFAVYARALQPKGLLLVHISNRYVELEPVVDAAAKAGGWRAMILDHYPVEAERARRATASMWVAMSRDPVTIDNLLAASGPNNLWRPLVGRPDFAGWSDDYASILPLIKTESLVPFNR